MLHILKFILLKNDTHTNKYKVRLPLDVFLTVHHKLTIY